MTVEHINPPDLVELPGGCQVTVATGSRIVNLAGQTGVDQHGELAGPTYHDQTRQAFRNIDIALAAAGASIDDVVKATIYVVGYDQDALGQIFAALGDHVADGGTAMNAATTLVGVAALWQPGILIEIDVTAVIA